MKHLLLALLAGTLSFASASNLSGKWKIDASARGRSVEMRMDLRQTGEDLSGSIQGPKGRSYPIQDASVEGHKFRFVLGGDGPLAGTKVSGMEDAEKLRLTLSMPRGSAKGVATRAE